MMAFTPKAPKWPWRDFLTPDEEATLKAADDAKEAWLRLNAERASITNRAIQRAKYAGRAAWLETLAKVHEELPPPTTYRGKRAQL